MRCLQCLGRGMVPVRPSYDLVVQSHFVTCPVCLGEGVYQPPVRHARRKKHWWRGWGK